MANLAGKSLLLDAAFALAAMLVVGLADNSISAIPDPASLGLFALAGGSAFWFARRNFTGS